MDIVHPLHLPKGSVRAIIAVAITGTVIALILRGIEVPEKFFYTWDIVLGTYFGSRFLEIKAQRDV